MAFVFPETSAAGSFAGLGAPPPKSQKSAMRTTPKSAEYFEQRTNLISTTGEIGTVVSSPRGAGIFVLLASGETKQAVYKPGAGWTFQPLGVSPEANVAKTMALSVPRPPPPGTPEYDAVLARAGGFTPPIMPDGGAAGGGSKKVIFIGLSVLLLGAVAYYVLQD